ncbi:MAG: hypothetical protein Q8N23_14865 [Archangium sp.]|nr:hypothetical protein [Archangium sp.]MDP3153952.1 hypothetical protein [Archangium sp.]MDP3574227.1 hypothetical protein [Archangium sp.]
MGTWGSGLWDNDASLDALPELIHVPPSKDLTHLLASWGLRLWFDRCAPKDFARAIERKSKEVIKLPKPLFEALAAIAQRPDSFKEKRSRSAPHHAILGGSADGYRIDPVFALPEVRALVGAVVRDRCAAQLDAVLTGPSRVSLYEDHLTGLGVLLELTNVGLFQPADRVARWRAGYAEMNALTPEERDFWDELVPRVEALFISITDTQ